MGEGVKSSPFLKSVTHILQSYNEETWYSFTLPKEDPKNMNHVTHHLSSPNIGIFSREISKICYIKKYSHFDT